MNLGHYLIVYTKLISVVTVDLVVRNIKLLEENIEEYVFYVFGISNLFLKSTKEVIIIKSDKLT